MFLLLWAFFFSSMYIRACCRRASTAVLQYREHSTAQAHTLSSQNERRNRNLPGLQKCNYSHNAGVMREGFAFSFDLNMIQHCPFSPSFLCISYMHAASGLSSRSMELLAFASRQFASKIVDLSVRFIRILCYPPL